MSILSSTRSGKAFYYNKIKEWYINDVEGLVYPSRKEDEIDVYDTDGTIILYNKTTCWDNEVFNSLPELGSQFNIEFRRLGNNRSMYLKGKKTDCIFLQKICAHNLNLLFQNNRIVFKSCHFDKIENWNAKYVDFSILEERNTITHRLEFPPTIINELNNCTFKRFEIGYRSHYYSEGEKGGQTCSIMLDDISNCKFDQLLITDENICENAFVKTSKVELTQEAKDVLTRFGQKNEYKNLYMSIKNDDKYYKIRKRKGNFFIQVVSYKQTTVN